MERIPKFNKRRAYNKAVGPGKSSKINNRRVYVYYGLQSIQILKKMSNNLENWENRKNEANLSRILDSKTSRLGMNFQSLNNSHQYYMGNYFCKIKQCAILEYNSSKPLKAVRLKSSFSNFAITHQSAPQPHSDSLHETEHTIV